MPCDIEKRAYKAELCFRGSEFDVPPYIEGYAAVFDSPSEDLGGFTEEIRQGAFSRSLQNRPDVRATLEHQGGLSILGRSSSTPPTLTLEEDDRGLKVRITPPDTQVAHDVVALVNRGDLNQMSFAFSVRDDEWRTVDGKERRTLLDVDLHDVSIVAFPAYRQTDVSIAMRSFKVWQTHLLELEERLEAQVAFMKSIRK